ncbi:MAG: EamA family transporter [Stomatobaculum sp.]
MKWYFIWPVLMVVLSNTFYNISQKSAPAEVNAFGTLTVTYLVAAGITAALFLATAGVLHVPEELRKLNWTAPVLGVSIVGLEAGYLYLYRAGWKVSAGSVACNITLAIVLLFVGAFLYRETITAKQLLGIGLCALGLALVTR